MSARVRRPHHPESAHACVVEALHRLVYRIGVCEVGRLLGMSESQMHRRLALRHMDHWSGGDVLTLKRRERDEFGTRTLHEAEERALYDDAARGEAIAAAGDLARSNGLHGQIIALEANILEDGKVTERDRAAIEQLETKLQAAHAADLRALASLRAAVPARETARVKWVRR